MAGWVGDEAGQAGMELGRSAASGAPAPTLAPAAVLRFPGQRSGQKGLPYSYSHCPTAPLLNLSNHLPCKLHPCTHLSCPSPEACR